MTAAVTILTIKHSVDSLEMAEDGRLIRLFPVPFRLVEDDQQFKRWQLICARVLRQRLSAVTAKLWRNV